MIPLRSLLVEDSEDDALLVVSRLRHAGFDPTYIRVETANQLRSALTDKTWDVIISDYALPGFGGLEALEIYKGLGLDIPFIIVSGAIGEDTAVGAMRSGAHDYIMKDNLVRLAPAIERELVEAQVRHERRDAEAALRLAASVFANSMEGIMITDPNAHMIQVNNAFTDITGYTADEVIGKTPVMLASGQHTAPFFRQMWRALSDTGYWRGEIQNRRKNGESFPAWLTISSVRDQKGEVTHYIGSLIDLSVQRRAEERVRYLSHYDALTDLPNRALLRDKLKHALLRAGHRNQEIIYMQFDLDRFTRVNDSLGHYHGDRLLQRVSQRLRQCTSETDIVARLGGDEFAVVLVEGERDDSLSAITEKLTQCFRDPFVLGSREVSLTASIGVARFPHDTKDADALIKYAERALQQAKLSGGVRRYSPAMDAQSVGQVHLEGALRQALDKGEFVTHYQPQVDLESGRIVGAEALIRWSRGEHWLVSPSEFLAGLEETGLIVEVGHRMIERACRDFRAWRDLGATLEFVSVNLSLKQFWQPDLVQGLTDIFVRTGVDPRCLCLEIAESSLTDNGRTVQSLLTELRDIGVRIAVDNIGSRQYSLNVIRKFPIDIIKIDRSFIQGSSQTGEDRSTIESIVEAAHPLNLRVIAEGIERAAQYEQLKESGCDLGQGFFCGRPMESTEFTHLVVNNRGHFAATHHTPNQIH